MKINEVVKSFNVGIGIYTLELDGIYPIALIRGVDNIIIKTLIDDKESSINRDGVIYMNKAIVETFAGGTLEFILGPGYFALIDEEWTDKFHRKVGWTGGDGIFSFNLTDGNDRFDQKQPGTTLFVFGDTFVGRVDKKTQKRYQPLLMPNNTLGYLDYNKSKVEFHVNRNDKDSVVSFFAVDKRFNVKGTIAQNLVTYDQKHDNEGWLSGYHPQIITLSFDLGLKQEVTHLNVYNYFSGEDPSLSVRGIKNFNLLASNDNKIWDFLGEYQLKQSHNNSEFEKILIGKQYRYFNFVINPYLESENYNDEYNEGLYGLSRVEFYSGKQKLRDVDAEADSVLLEEPGRFWLWLQDGVVINQHLYFFPLIVYSDLNQPEGLQFGIKGITMIKVPIVRGRLDYQSTTQKLAPLLVQKDESEFLLGGAIMANTAEAGAVNPDGYIYVYGYKTTFGLRQMIVARVKAELIEYFDQWEYFDGEEWTYDILSSAPLLDHISCEFSVSPILAGRNKGKYLAVFTYDVNTPFVAFSIGESKVGPFTAPQIIYHTPEQAKYKSTTYTYNAKAHPHLSQSTAVLVSYNTNTYSFDHNIANGDLYRPRFIRLIEIEKEQEDLQQRGVKKNKTKISFEKTL